jgi:hypothetical protein
MKEAVVRFPRIFLLIAIQERRVPVIESRKEWILVLVQNVGISLKIKMPPGFPEGAFESGERKTSAYLGSG